MYRFLYSVLLLSVLAAGCSRKAEPTAGQQPTDSLWMTDFNAAKQKAAAEGKDLLVNFSGSDWCYWCKRLEAEVFSVPMFVEQAASMFVFVLIDFPKNKSGQPRAVQEQNRRLADQFHIRGYPTVMLMRSDGSPYAETGYVEGGAAAYLSHLRQLQGQK